MNGCAAAATVGAIPSSAGNLSKGERVRTRIRAGIAGAAVLALVMVMASEGASFGAQSKSNSGSGSNAKAASLRNPWGILMVRFAKGTSAQQRQAAVTQAGGEVVTDLGAINAVAVASTKSGLASRLRANKAVTAVWQDRIMTTGRDDAGGNGPLPGATGLKTGDNANLTPPDPWHDLPSFLGETNPEGILQWDDNRNGVRQAWSTTTGSKDIRVAVIDSGVQGSHKEILPNYDNQTSTNTIPCNTLTRLFGSLAKEFQLKDCSSEDTLGHGTWVASRIAGAVNDFASNGISPHVTVIGIKSLATPFGGLTSWIVDGMIHACNANVDAINFSIGGYDDPNDPDFAKDNIDDFFLWTDAVKYCNDRGTAVFAAAGNEHVLINRVTATLTGTSGTRTLSNVGLVASDNRGIEPFPGDTELIKYQNDFRGMLETPAGVPGVVMVSSTGNAIHAPTSDVPAALRPPTSVVGTIDNLAYYSNYGSRVDVAAPGGARRLAIPKFDGGPNDFLYGGWGILGAVDPSGELCASAGSLLDFACFKVQGAGFGWLQGTSMSTPEATGVAALVLAAHPELRKHPAALAAQLKATARTNMTNHTGPSGPSKAPSYNGTDCALGYCHIDWSSPIGFSDAYGAGMVNAAAAVQ